MGVFFTFFIVVFLGDFLQTPPNGTKLSLGNSVELPMLEIRITHPRQV